MTMELAIIIVAVALGLYTFLNSCVVGSIQRRLDELMDKHNGFVGEAADMLDRHDKMLDHIATRLGLSRFKGRIDGKE